MLWGVLALQGDFSAHRKLLDLLGCSSREVRSPKDLDGIDGLVVPGGESTTMVRLLMWSGLWERLVELGREGLPILGTCAGLILLARDVDPPQPSLGLLGISVRRNAYGRQIHSKVRPVKLADSLGGEVVDGVFIRAPKIVGVDPDVEVLAVSEGGPVAVRSGNVVGASYHPELSGDTTLHRILLGGSSE